MKHPYIPQGADQQGRWQDTQPEAGHAATEVGADQPITLDDLVSPVWKWVIRGWMVVAVLALVAAVTQ